MALETLLFPAPVPADIPRLDELVEVGADAAGDLLREGRVDWYKVRTAHAIVRLWVRAGRVSEAHGFAKERELALRARLDPAWALTSDEVKVLFEDIGIGTRSWKPGVEPIEVDGLVTLLCWPFPVDEADVRGGLTCVLARSGHPRLQQLAEGRLGEVRSGLDVRLAAAVMALDTFAGGWEDWCYVDRAGQTWSGLGGLGFSRLATSVWTTRMLAADRPWERDVRSLGERSLMDALSLDEWARNGFSQKCYVMSVAGPFVRVPSDHPLSLRPRMNRLRAAFPSLRSGGPDWTDPDDSRGQRRLSPHWFQWVIDGAGRRGATPQLPTGWPMGSSATAS